VTWSLSEELAAVRAELARVDSKCATLAGLAGAAAEFTATQAGHGPGAVSAATAAAAVLVFVRAVLVLLLTVLRPRFGGSGFCRYAAMTTQHIASVVTIGRSGGSIFDGVWASDIGPDDLVTLARITHAKYRRLRAAVDLMAAGVVLLAAAVVAGLIA